MVRSRFSLPARLIVLSALLLSFILSLGTVSAAATVTANPALVPFDPTPGKPGTTTLTFNADGTSGLTACGQDNAQPPFALGPVASGTPLVIPFPFIQAGKYTFWESADSGCAGAKLATATATRVGPTGKAGQDDIAFRSFGVPIDDVNIVGTGIDGQQKFPIPSVSLCFMSADGAQVDIPTKVGQDSRSGKGLGSGAATTTVLPVAGQNGCFDIPWLVNGGYTATIVRSGASATFGFCTGTNIGANKPSVDPPPTKCAQVAFTPALGGVPSGTTINGSIVTGADNHAVEVCVSAFFPTPIPFGGVVPTQILANTANAYNQSGAVNLTPLKLAFPFTAVTQVTTYDITGPGPGGQGGAQFVCPPTVAVPNGSTVVIIPTSVPGAAIIDVKNYTIA